MCQGIALTAPLYYIFGVAFEIELKAWVSDGPKTASALSEYARPLYSYHKEDTYYLPHRDVLNVAHVSGVRIRKEIRKRNNQNETRLIVTYKSKELREIIEVNTEHEFFIEGSNSAEEFERLLIILGLEKSYTKTKKGDMYRIKNINAELTNIENLGLFLELEIISDTDETSVINAARTELNMLLEKVGIDKKSIETKYYSELLHERGFI